MKGASIVVHILLVEDDPEVARIIKYYLAQEEQYEITWVRNVHEAVSASRDCFDIILLDVMLPDGDGISLCAQLRQWHSCPVIFVSCLDDSESIVSALNQGGDDFIVKPFNNQVLLARIQANLRRVQMEHSVVPPNVLACKGFSLDAATHELIKNGAREKLSPMEFRILAFFMQNPGRTFKPNELYKLIWGKVDYGDHRTVIVHIHALRKKIEQDPVNPKYLKSIWGKGYIFEPD